MKKIRLFAFCAAAAVFTACEVSEQFEPAFTDELSPDEPIELSDASEVFVFTSDPDDSDLMTRTEHDGSQIIWSAGDQIRMGMTINDIWQGVNGNASSYTQAKLYASQELVSGGQTAAFTVPTNFSSTGSGTYKFYTVYPAAACAESGFSANNILTVSIPTEQTPAQASFDPAADLLVGASIKTYTSKPTDPIPLMWERLVAHGEITLKNLQGLTSGETVESVTLTAQSGAQLTGSYSVNLKTATVTGAVSASNSVTVSGDNLEFNGSNLTFWIGILPVTVTSLTVELETSAATYTREISSCNVVFAGNTHNTLGIKMQDVPRVEKGYQLVTAGTTDWTGDYVLARTNSGTTYAMGGKSGTNDFSSVSTVTVTNDMISLTQGSPLNIRIDKSTNGYTIKFGQLYLGYTSTSLSGNNYLYYSSTFTAEKYEWTISLLDENYVEIKNVYNTSRTLRFNSNQKDRFACYNGSQWYPNLYRLGQASGTPTPPDPQPEATATVTTSAAGSITQTTATLNGSFSGATGTISEVGFYWGTSSTPSTKVVSSGTATPFTYSLSNLTAGSTYYFQAYVKEYNASTSSVEERKGSVVSFTTEAQQTDDYYELVTESQSDWSGYYVLVYKDGSKILNSISTGSTPIGEVTDITISNNKIAYSYASQNEITIAKVSGSNTNYTLLYRGKYLGWTSGNSLTSNTSASSNQYYWTITYSSGTLTIANVGDSTRKLQYNNSNPRFACYTSSQKAPSLFKRSASGSSDPVATATVTSYVSNITASSAVLNGAYSNATGGINSKGFCWGTSSSNLSNRQTVSGNSFTLTISGLTENQTYYFKAFVSEWNATTGQYEERTSDINSFVASAQQNISNWYIGCYEVPAVGVVSNYAKGDEVLGYTSGNTTAYTTWRRWDTSNSKQKLVTHTFYNDNANATENRIMRSYTLLQDKDKKCALWVACAMNNGAYPTGASRSDKWAYDPALGNDWQPDLSDGYQNLNGASYDRGHQIGSAYRASTLNQRKMTCYFTNMTPQLSSLNQGAWNTQVEEKVRTLGNNTSGNDTLYVVSGPLFIGSYDTVKDASGTPCARPTHYYQCFMKVHFNNGVPQSAKGAAYLIEHTASATAQYKTIDYIESLAGFDFFANVPASVQNTAEATATPYSDF